MRWVVLFIAGVIAGWALPGAAQTVLVVESQYNTIILEREGGHLSLLFGYGDKRFTQAVHSLDDPESLPVPYTRFLTLALAYAPPPRRIAEIGAATAQTSAYLARALTEAQVTAVELDGAILKLASSHFGVSGRPNLSLVQQDGRVFLTRSREHFEILLIDVYRGPFVPFHLTTREFYELAKTRLAKGGVLAINIEPTTLLFEPTLVTLGAVFDHVDLYPADANFVAIAYDGVAKSDASLRNQAKALDASLALRHPLGPLVEERMYFANPVAGPPPLTDDFAPTEFLGAVKRHNARRTPDLTK